MTERDDAALLSAIAQRRDLEAFTELYQRYQKPAYNVAYHFIHNQALAEEAVQEAMLSVWESAAAYRSDGSAKAWIFSIVTTRCLKVSRTRKRSLQREERKRAMERAESMSTASEGIEREESVQALQSQMEKLADLERQLLTLFYGAELSQQEISKLLSIPQQTVSFKLRGALERLKTNLVEVGFGAVVPLMTPAGLNRALLTSYEPSPDLCAKVLHRLQNPAHKLAQKMSRRISSQRPSAPIAAGIGVVVLAVVGLALWISRPAPSPVQPAPIAAPPLEPEKPVAAIPPPAGKIRLQRAWSFATGPATDLTEILGRWTWKKQADNVGVMDVPPGPAEAVVLPVRIPKECLELIVTRNGIGRNGEATIDTLWMQDRTIIPFKEYIKQTMSARESSQSRIYINGPYIITIHTGQQASHLQEYDAPYPSEKICFLFQNYSIEKIELRSIAPEDLPESIRDIEALKRSFNAPAAPGKNSGLTIQFLDK